jgi:hypothetical protein
MQLSIPSRHKGAFIRFLRLPFAARQGLVRAIRKSSPQSSVAGLASRLSLGKFGLDSESTEAIVRFLASLYRFKTDVEIPAEKIAEDFVATGRAELRGLPDSDKYDWDGLKKTVLEILKLDESLGLAARASELSSENDHRLCPLNCRILTDARPVFVGSASKPPSAVLLQHSLKIAYHHADEEAVKEFYVTLDGDDLEYLMYVLGRAKAKEKSIRRLMVAKRITVLGSIAE